MITKETIRKQEQITTYIRKADEALEALGYTEHSFAHVTRAASFAEAARILLRFDSFCRNVANERGVVFDE